MAVQGYNKTKCSHYHKTYILITFEHDSDKVYHDVKFGKNTILIMTSWQKRALIRGMQLQNIKTFVNLYAQKKLLPRKKALSSLHGITGFNIRNKAKTGNFLVFNSIKSSLAKY